MEKVPKETETIAHKRAIRLSEKLKAARALIGLKSNWWTSGWVEFFGLGILFVINFVLALPMIGAPAVSVSFSGPVVPILSRLISLTGAPFMYSIQLINVIFFLAFPITFYFFVKFVSGRKFAAFLSTLIVTLPIFVFAKARFEFGLLSNESPYIASLTILLIAIIMLLKFLRNGGIKNLIVCSVVTAFTALISPFGIFVFVIMSAITTFSEMLLGEGRIKILRLLTVYLFSASLTSFWYNPGFFFWMVTGPMGTEIRDMIGHIIPISLFAVPILACIGYLLFDRKPGLQPFFLALFYTLIFLIIVIMGGGFVPSNPGRYTPVLGISLAFLIGVSVLMGFEHLHFSKLSNIVPVKGTKDIFLIFVSLGLITFILTGRNLVNESQDNVLGIWTDVQKGDVWVARDKFSVQNSIPGYLISATGFGTLVYLYRKKENI